MKFVVFAAPLAGLIALCGAASVQAQDAAPAAAPPAAGSGVGSGAAPSGRPHMSDDMRAQMQALRAACADDMAKLCPDVKTREDRRTCMTANHDKFSDTCKAALADMRQKMQSMRAGDSGGQ